MTQNTTPIKVGDYHWGRADIGAPWRVYRKIEAGWESVDYSVRVQRIWAAGSKVPPPEPALSPSQDHLTLAEALIQFKEALQFDPSLPANTRGMVKDNIFKPTILQDVFDIPFAAALQGMFDRMDASVDVMLTEVHRTPSKKHIGTHEWRLEFDTRVR